MSTLYVDNLQPNLGSRVMAAGHVVQVVQAVKTDTSSGSGTAWQSSGVSADITPTSSSSKVLVSVSVNLSNSAHNGGYVGLVLRRGSTNIYVGNASASRTQASVMTSGSRGSTDNGSYKMENMNFTFLDDPSTTSSTTYEIYVRASASAETWAVNRSIQDSNAAWQYRTPSSLTLQEIAQ